MGDLYSISQLSISPKQQRTHQTERLNYEEYLRQKGGPKTYPDAYITLKTSECQQTSNQVASSKFLMMLRVILNKNLVKTSTNVQYQVYRDH